MQLSLPPTHQQRSVSAFGHVPALDGIRLFAIGLVVLHHSLGIHHSSILLRGLAIQDGNGIGVPLFLLLSGFLLTNILLNTKDQPGRYTQFLFRRAIRIVPLYFAYLLTAVLFTCSVMGHMPQHFWVYVFFLQNYLPRTAEATNSALPLYHFWTLGVQEQFYFLWPLLVWSCSNLKQLRSLCWAGVVFSFVARLLFSGHLGSMSHMVEFLPFRVGEMCFGGLLAAEFRQAGRLTHILRVLTLPLAALYVVWAWLGLSYSHPAGFVLGLQLVTTACAGVVVHCLSPATLISRAFSLPWIASVGKRYSYAIYIFHVATLQTLSQTKAGLGTRRYALILPLAAILVWASHNLLEKYFMRMNLRSRPARVVPVLLPEDNTLVPQRA